MTHLAGIRRHHRPAASLQVAFLLLPVLFSALAAAGIDTAKTGSPQGFHLQDPHSEPGARAPMNRTAVVLIHGLGASASIWRDIEPYLRSTCEVFLYELPGHGRTTPLDDPSTASLSRMTDSLVEWMSGKGLESFHLIGHGIGGLIAMNFALDHPHRVRSLIAIDSGPRPLHSREQRTGIARLLLEDYDRFIASHFIGISEMEHVNEQAVDMALRTDSASLAALLLSSLKWDLSGQVIDLGAPLLVIGSEGFLPEAGSERLYLQHYGYEGAQGMKFKRIPGSGHYLMMENPSRLAETILVWLRNQG
jgi:pimeloyl-ACP methyl ester carboxylesterase